MSYQELTDEELLDVVDLYSNQSKETWLACKRKRWKQHEKAANMMKRYYDRIFGKAEVE